MRKRQDDKANTVLTKSIWKDAKATQLIQCRNKLTYETGFRTNRCTHKIQKKKRLVRYGRLNDVRRKCGGTNGREPGRIESVKKRTEGGRGKERRFTQQFLNKYFSSNRERNKERKRRKEEAEDRNARYGRRRGLDPLCLSTRNGEN